MSAGESAREVARRQRERAARLNASAERWERGAEGEAEVARVLDGLPEEWTVVHDVKWPGRARANIDHVVIGPGGVFVVDAKNWSGKVDVRHGVVTQNGRRRPQAVASASGAAQAVEALLPDGLRATGALCFVGEEPLVGMAGDVVLCSTANLAEMLTSRPEMLAANQVRAAAKAVGKESHGAAARKRSGMPRELSQLVAGLGGAALLLALTFSGALPWAADVFAQWFVGIFRD